MRVDTEAERDGGIGHWLAHAGNGYGEVEEAARGREAENVSLGGEQVYDLYIDWNMIRRWNGRTA